MKIFYTNDLHNRLGAIDWLENHIARESKSDPPILLDGGDAIGGSNTAFRLDEPALQRMRRLGFRAMAMGNREFHYFRWVQRWRECERGFPILAANLQDLRSRQQPWRSHMIIERPGASDGLERIGLIGLTPVQFPHHHFWEKVTGFRFDPPVDSLKRLVPLLKQDCQTIFLLSHLGISHDRTLAAQFPEISLILGAHCHSTTTVPEKIGEVTVVQTGSHSRHLGKLDLSFRDEKLLLDWTLVTL